MKIWTDTDGRGRTWTGVLVLFLVLLMAGAALGSEELKVQSAEVEGTGTNANAYFSSRSAGVLSTNAPPLAWVQFDSGATYDTALTNKWGGFMAIDIPTPSLNPLGSVAPATQMSAGIAGGYINHQVTFGAATLKLSGSVKLSSTWKLVLYADAGPSYNFKAGQVGTYSFTGIDLERSWSRWKLLFGYGAGNVSNIPGLEQALNVSLCWGFL